MPKRGVCVTKALLGYKVQGQKGKRDHAVSYAVLFPVHQYRLISQVTFTVLYPVLNDHKKGDCT